tara:strand:+ start:165 stop:368 length:204 start_codon:yes stop_codon:yes gene_type:complete
MIKLMDILFEAVKYDQRKMAKLVKKDRFLSYVVKKDFRGKLDKNRLEQLYLQYVKGDKDMEKAYKRA